MLLKGRCLNVDHTRVAFPLLKEIKKSWITHPPPRSRRRSRCVRRSHWNHCGPYFSRRVILILYIGRPPHTVTHSFEITMETPSRWPPTKQRKRRISFPLWRQLQRRGEGGGINITDSGRYFPCQHVTGTLGASAENILPGGRGVC